MPLNLYLRKETGLWHIRGSVQGIVYDRSARTRDRGEAEAIKAKVEADLFKRAVYGDRAVATFSEAVVLYINAGGSPDHLTPLLHRMGALRLADIDQGLVDKVAKELKPQAAPATVIRQIYTPVSAVLNHAAENKLCDPVKFRKPKVRNARTAYLTPQQAEDWLAALPDHLKRLVTFYLATGCRATEALALDWSDVTPEGKRVVFWETKGGYARGADLQRRARALLPERGKGEVFRNSRGEPWHCYDAINLMLKRVRAKREKEIASGSDLPHLVEAHCHLFRHTWATWAYACTRDLTFLMQQGGWKSVSMVMRYTHVGSDDLARAVLAAGWEFSGREVIRLPKRRAKSAA